ncbi:MAG: hypothetical protein IKL85_06880, partial [Lentisphaeria bacterium]|nr:hypothetical protein [Lentisphaeria bacterium]
ASCEREGRNLLAVVTGFPSAADRDNFIRALLDWGYAKIGVAKAKTSTSTKSSSTKSTSTKSSTSSKTTSTKKGR